MKLREVIVMDVRSEKRVGNVFAQILDLLDNFFDWSQEV